MERGQCLRVSELRRFPEGNISALSNIAWHTFLTHRHDTIWYHNSIVNAFWNLEQLSRHGWLVICLVYSRCCLGYSGNRVASVTLRKLYTQQDSCFSIVTDTRKVILVFRVATQCSFTGVYQRFGGTHNLLFQDIKPQMSYNLHWTYWKPLGWVMILRLFNRNQFCNFEDAACELSGRHVLPPTYVHIMHIVLCYFAQYAFTRGGQITVAGTKVPIQLHCAQCHWSFS
jgi:hypothetical protein